MSYKGKSHAAVPSIKEVLKYYRHILSKWFKGYFKNILPVSQTGAQDTFFSEVPHKPKVSHKVVGGTQNIPQHLNIKTDGQMDGRTSW